MTTLACFFDALTQAGVRLVRAGHGLQLRGPAGAITPALRDAARAHKAELLALLGLPAHPASAHGPIAVPGPDGAARPAPRQAEPLPTVILDGRPHPYLPRWRGEPLCPADGYLAFDTETEVVDLRGQVPRMALASASAGERDSCLIHPDDVGTFILAHRDLHFVCFNASFDFWAVEEHLRQRGEEAARRALWDIADQNRLHDAMLLDMLLRLARDDTYPRPRNLGVVAREYTGLEVDKQDPYRLRYGEIIGQDWATVPSRFFEYAIRDAIVTLPTYLAIRQQAEALVATFDARDFLPGAHERWGLLTECVQVKKSIALAQITRNGMHLDRERLCHAEADLRQRLAGAVARVRQQSPGLFKTDKAGNLCLTPSGAPRKKQAALLGELRAVLDSWPAEAGPRPCIPRTCKAGRLSTSTAHWAEYADKHPFVREWLEVEELAKLLQFFAHLREEHIHPAYASLVRTGRTSCSGPNIQNVPREGAFRRAFVASPGHLLLAVDYSFIELRTLAAVCLHRYGRSALAEVIRGGADPHAHTAALILGIPAEEFSAWKASATHGERYADARQKAKAVNFGVPGGMGTHALLSYARATYGVTLTSEEARAQRERLIQVVYPELNSYLAEDAHAVLARTLRAPVEEVCHVLGDVHLASVRKVLEGEPRKKDGTPYRESFVARVWEALAALNRDRELEEALRKREPSRALAVRVCHAGVATLTGRIRGRVRYSQGRNTPFQGLAADGAALALFALVREGFRVVAFVHDEVLVELPDEGGHVSEGEVRRVEGLLCREMEGVLVGGIPVACESALCRRWDKKARLVVRDGKAFPWEPEPAVPADRSDANQPARYPASPDDPRGGHAADGPTRPARGSDDQQEGPGAGAHLPGKVSPPLKWHGGKHYLAARIMALMPPHLHYVEPFCGGLAVLLARDPNDRRLWLSGQARPGGVSEVVNDLNGRLINFWRVLRDAEHFPRFVRRCQATEMSRAVWEEAHGGGRRPDPVEDAWAFFVDCRQSRAGTFKGFTSLTRSRTRRGVNGNASEWLGAVEGLAAVHARLRPVVIESMDALALIAREDGEGTLFYCDPPYLHETRATTDVYAHEMSREGHHNLLCLLCGCKAKVMLSGYRSEMYDDLLAGWNRHDFAIANHAAGGKKKRRMTECLWCNF
jgi:DNA adenine methylase